MYESMSPGTACVLNYLCGDDSDLSIAGLFAEAAEGFEFDPCRFDSDDLAEDIVACIVADFRDYLLDQMWGRGSLPEALECWFDGFGTGDAFIDSLIEAHEYNWVQVAEGLIFRYPHVFDSFADRICDAYLATA